MAGFGKPYKKGEGGRPKGVPNKVTREIREVAENLIGNPEYLAKLRVRLDRGTAPHMETLLWHYRYGKPKERVEIEGSAPLPLVIELVTDRRQLGEPDVDAGGDSDDE